MKKMIFFCLVVGLVVGLPVKLAWPAELVGVPIRNLDVAPWLGALRNQKELLQKFREEKKNFINYLLYDLKSFNIEITPEEARELADSIEKSISKAEKVSLPDGSQLLSIGLKSPIEGLIWRKAHPVFTLGRPVEAFRVEILWRQKNYLLEYVFLTESGNICLKEIRKIKVQKKEKTSPFCIGLGGGVSFYTLYNEEKDFASPKESVSSIKGAARIPTLAIARNYGGVTGGLISALGGSPKNFTLGVGWGIPWIELPSFLYLGYGGGFFYSFYDQSFGVGGGIILALVFPSSQSSEGGVGIGIRYGYDEKKKVKPPTVITR